MISFENFNFNGLVHSNGAFACDGSWFSPEISEGFLRTDGERTNDMGHDVIVDNHKFIANMHSEATRNQVDKNSAHHLVVRAYRNIHAVNNPCS